MALCLALCLARAPTALAQQTPPHLGYVYPAGGQTGTSFIVEAGGQRLGNVDGACFSITGIEAVVIEHEPAPTQQEAMTLRERRKELAQQKNKTPEVLKELADINRKLTKVEKRRINPALADTVPLRMTIAPNVPPGTYEMRVRSPAGLSNPRVFQVGQLMEVNKLQPSADDFLAPRKDRRPDGTPIGTPPAQPMEIVQPAVVNGWIPPGGVDRYRFHARAGEKLTIVTSARELIPYLADAVPGWFQAAVALYDAQGRELAYDDHYRFRPDPALFCTIPGDGDYTLEIHDALYRGREDFVYRIAIGDLPFVTGIFPLGGRTGTPVTVAIQGWNLETDRVTLQSRDPGVTSLVVRSAGRLSNRVPIAFDALPERFEKEPNHSSAKANPVARPVIINGRIEAPGDVDVFRFEGEAGQQIVAEVYARRLDSPLDSVLRLSDAAGRQLAFNDDHDDKGAGLLTHQADSYLSATLPSNGTYFVQLWDAQNKGGWAYAYRLHLRAPQPDFALRIDPSSVSVRTGSSAPLTVYVLRKDGFTNEIALALQDAPAGFKLSAARVLTNQDQTKITLSAPPTRVEEPFNLRIAGRALIDGREVVHPVVPADDMMQAFAYRHLVTAQELMIGMMGPASLRDVAKIVTPTPIKLPAGGTALVQVRIPTGPRIEKLDFELSEPPEGITLQGSSFTKEATELKLQCDGGIVLPDQKGSLIVKVFGERAPDAEKPDPTNRVRRVSLGVLPAIPFVIVQPLAPDTQR